MTASKSDVLITLFRETHTATTPATLLLLLITMTNNNQTETWEQLLAVTYTVMTSAMTMMEEEEAFMDNHEEDQHGEDNHRRHPRNDRTRYNHESVRRRLEEDFFGTIPVFDGRQFQTFFRISRQRFQTIMEDVANSGNRFYQPRKSSAGLKERLLLPIKTLAYGVGYVTFTDYFHMSPTFARDCCLEFDRIMNNLYTKEYLRSPDAADLIAINKLHLEKHGIQGMFGSLDCCHTRWKNCPVAWQGNFKGKEGVPTLVLEASCDYQLWFWHAAFGFAGTLNDTNILKLSPLLNSFTDGSFEGLERQAGVVPFAIHDQEFSKMFVLVDGIYPQWARFVKAMREPTSPAEKRFTTWQEAARKDIERAFGVLQGTWQWTARPIHAFKPSEVADRMRTCLILHNMIVNDRVMDGYPARTQYDPSRVVLDDRGPEEQSFVEQPEDLHLVQQVATQFLPHGVTEEGAFARWHDMENRLEHQRLFQSLLASFSSTE